MLFECYTCKGDGVLPCVRTCYDYDRGMASHVHVCTACSGQGRKKHKPHDIVRLASEKFPYKRVL